MQNVLLNGNMIGPAGCIIQSLAVHQFGNGLNLMRGRDRQCLVISIRSGLGTGLEQKRLLVTHKALQTDKSLCRPKVQRCWILRPVGCIVSLLNVTGSTSHLNSTQRLDHTPPPQTRPSGAPLRAFQTGTVPWRILCQDIIFGCCAGCWAHTHVMQTLRSGTQGTYTHASTQQHYEKSCIQQQPENVYGGPAES